MSVEIRPINSGRHFLQYRVTLATALNIPNLLNFQNKNVDFFEIQNTLIIGV
jgi:hypothetical protein